MLGRGARDGTGSSSWTNIEDSFSNMAVSLRFANLLKGLNSTMLVLAVCGRRLFPESRIVGGNRSSFGKWPWQVSTIRENSRSLNHSELKRKSRDRLSATVLFSRISKRVIQRTCTSMYVCINDHTTRVACSCN